jgi:hypothetical protein
MIAPQPGNSVPFFEENVADRPAPPELLALQRQLHFHAFLREEMEACRTETEKEVVLSALAATRVRMARLLRRIKLLSEESQ